MTPVQFWVAPPCHPRVDRYILERVVFPALAAVTGVTTLLFAGVDWYGKDYEKSVPGRRFHAIDNDRAASGMIAASRSPVAST